MIKHNLEVKLLRDSNNEALKILSNERTKNIDESFALIKNERDRLNIIHEQKLKSIEK